MLYCVHDVNYNHESRCSLKLRFLQKKAISAIETITKCIYVVCFGHYCK